MIRRTFSVITIFLVFSIWFIWLANEAKAGGWRDRGDRYERPSSSYSQGWREYRRPDKYYGRDMYRRDMNRNRFEYEGRGYSVRPGYGGRGMRFEFR